MQTYGEIKRKLFMLPGLRYAVINVDDPFGKEILAGLPGHVQAVAYSLDPQTATEVDAEHQGNVMYLGCVHATNLSLQPKGLSCQLNSPWGSANLQSELLGRFNASNLLAVAAVLLLRGNAIDDVANALSHLQSIKGRMQTFTDKSQPLVVVDYAHTPDALEQALQALQAHCKGDIYCVFGCGGDRDTGKRALMGKVANDYCQHITLTNDNPRSEDPDAIINDILGGITDKGKVHIETNRHTAIQVTIAQATPKDVVLVAGKGHENYQLIADRRLPFSDIDTVNELLQEAAQ
jgi:UDP-N-acetylmuramoyl-L-alanyl-D-glutamate--2,6-diaminopimelate ligase